MNTFNANQSCEEIGGHLMENLGEQLLPVIDMTDPKTADFYWAFMRLQGNAIAAQLNVAFGLGLLKRVASTD
jgi:hypothetical protein